MKKYFLIFTGVILLYSLHGWGTKRDGALYEKAFEQSASLAEARELTEKALALTMEVQELERHPESFSSDGKPSTKLKVARKRAKTARRLAKIANQYSQTTSLASIIYCRWGFM